MSRIGKSTETEHRPGVPKGWGVLVTGVTANGYRVILRGDEHALELDGGDVFRKGRGTRDQIANIHRIMEKAREFQKNIYFCFIDYAKALTMRITTNFGKFFKRWEYQTILPASWEICMQVKKQQLGLDMEQHTSSKSGTENVKAAYYHPAYLTYMQSTSCEVPGWMKQKPESRLPGEISITSDMQMTPLLWQKVKKN